jgi:hypothetical protein
VNSGRSSDEPLMGYHSESGTLNNTQKKAASRLSRSFGFEERARARPKPISQVKLEQDLEIKRRQVEAIHNFKFVANTVRWAWPSWAACRHRHSNYGP